MRIGYDIENQVRRQFGFKDVGEAWTSETILFYMVKELYPEAKIIHHRRPEFLGQQEIDIYQRT